ncbi:hypothetical protein HPB50_026573 [Hyalomma asiaticum]|uniref:Uncharacterized protein n=1 Tax=Hyalomma asiaticum TaxID=266040 RepID=A0ACB7TR61_HYAAI|nr:hypothetical protein HPB50_026573 [Hyalomma asiaticum]
MSGDKKEVCGNEKVSYERDVDGDGKDMYGDDKDKSCNDSDVFYDANDTFDTSHDANDTSHDKKDESHDEDKSYEEDESYEEEDESCDETGESCGDSQAAGDSMGDAAECSASNEVTSEEKENKYFDSGDYNMAKAQGQNADGSPDREVKPTGDVIPTVDKLPPRHAIVGPSKLVTKTSP